MIYKVLKPELFIAETKLLGKYDLWENNAMNPTHICHSKTIGTKEDFEYMSFNSIWCGFNIENCTLEIICNSFGGMCGFEFTREHLENPDLSKIDRDCMEYYFNFIDDLKENGVIRRGGRMNNKSFEELKEYVLDWADDKDLLDEENADKQFMKFIEEVFEFKTEMDFYFNKTEILKLINQEHMEDEMGDIFVTLIILCEQLELDPVVCLEVAYKKISKRQGKTINGNFYKQEDLEGMEWQK